MFVYLVCLPPQHHYEHCMLNLTTDKSAVAASIVANIILGFSIELQKYAKRKIIELALHGLPAESVERMWRGAFALLVVAQCMYYVWYGLSGTTTMTPIGVYTAIANCVLPPLFYESRPQTTIGSLCTMMGILALIFVPAQNNSEIVIHWDNGLKYTLAVFLVVCMGLCILRSYKPANCSLKLTANCGVTSLLGAFSVGCIKLLTDSSILNGDTCTVGNDSGGLCAYIPLGWALLLIIFVIQLLLLAETLEYFPVWQVVAHHHILFSIFLLAENITVFKLYDEGDSLAVTTACLAHALQFLGVWTAAKPHLDIPASIPSSKMLPLLKEIYHHEDQTSMNDEGATLSHTQGIVNNPQLNNYRNEMKLCCVQEVYCSMMHKKLKTIEGFNSKRHYSGFSNDEIESSNINTPCLRPAAEP